MAREWVTDGLWNEIKPLLPERPPRPRGGRPPADDRACLVGILFVLHTGCGWNQIPGELAPSGPTCWRRFRAWTEAGVWADLWRRILRHLGKDDGVDLARAVVDSASFRAVFGGAIRGRTPRIAGKTAANAT
jgi:transposase